MKCAAIAAESTQGSGLEFSPNKCVCFRNLPRNSKFGEVKAFRAYVLGRPKKAFSSETIFPGLATTFSHYLGIKQCRKTKIEKKYEYLLLVKGVQIFST